MVVPTILNGYTDSHQMREAFGTVAYGIWPVRSTPYDVVASGVHGADERIHVDDLGYGPGSTSRPAALSARCAESDQASARCFRR